MFSKSLDDLYNYIVSSNPNPKKTPEFKLPHPIKTSADSGTDTNSVEKFSKAKIKANNREIQSFKDKLKLETINAQNAYKTKPKFTEEWIKSITLLHSK